MVNNGLLTESEVLTWPALPPAELRDRLAVLSDRELCLAWCTLPADVMRKLIKESTVFKARYVSMMRPTLCSSYWLLHDFGLYSLLKHGDERDLRHTVYNMAHKTNTSEALDPSNPGWAEVKTVDDLKNLLDSMESYASREYLYLIATAETYMGI